MSHRQPGPLCSTTSVDDLDEGTLACTSSPLPGPVCLTQGRAADAIDQAEKINEARRLVQGMVNSCAVPLAPLSEADFAAAARSLGVPVEIVKAVTMVEAPPIKEIHFEGRVKILFERHYFHRLTKGAFDKTHPQLSQKFGGGYGAYREQYDKLGIALGLNASAALESASWGRFQIMGENFPACGYNSVEEMVAAFMTSERSQLDAFVALLKKEKKPAWTALQSKPPLWTQFASSYNGTITKDGKKQVRDNYDQRLKAAYEKLVKAATKPAAPGSAKPLKLP